MARTRMKQKLLYGSSRQASFTFKVSWMTHEIGTDMVSRRTKTQQANDTLKRMGLSYLLLDLLLKMERFWNCLRRFFRSCWNGRWTSCGRSSKVQRKRDGLRWNVCQIIGLNKAWFPSLQYLLIRNYFSNTSNRFCATKRHRHLKHACLSNLLFQ